MSKPTPFELHDIKDPLTWDMFIENSPQGTIFMSSHFLTATGFDVDYYGLSHKGETIAVIAVPHQNGIPVHNNEILNQYNGLCFTQDIFEKPHHARSKLMVQAQDFIFQTLCTHYSKLSFFLHPTLDDIRGIQWVHYHNRDQGMFNIQPIYTGILDLTATNDLDQIISQMTNNRRRDYKKALKNNFTASSSNDIDLLLKLYQDTFARQNITVEKNMLNQLASIATAALEKDFGNILVCKTADKEIISASLIVDDAHSSHYLIGTNNPDFRNSGAGTFLMLHAIDHARQNNKKSFDFIGINSPTRGDFKLSFGAKPVMTFTIDWTKPTSYKALKDPS